MRLKGIEKYRIFHLLPPRPIAAYCPMCPDPCPPIAASLILPANNIYKKPREMSQFGKKSAKVYHCLYSSTEQLQVAL